MSEYLDQHTPSSLLSHCHNLSAVHSVSPRLASLVFPVNLPCLVLLQLTAYIDQGYPDVTANLSVKGTVVVRSFGSLLRLNRLLPPKKHSLSIHSPPFRLNPSFQIVIGESSSRHPPQGIRFSITNTFWRHAITASPSTAYHTHMVTACGHPDLFLPLSFQGRLYIISVS